MMLVLVNTPMGAVMDANVIIAQFLGLQNDFYNFSFFVFTAPMTLWYNEGERKEGWKRNKKPQRWNC